MRRRPWWLGAGAALVVVLALAAWVLVTDVGAPDDPLSTPEPCDLLSADTVRDLIGQEVPGQRSGTRGTWRPLHREERVTCEWTASGRGILAGHLSVAVDHHHSTQFGLGPTGTRRAQEFLDDYRPRCYTTLPVDQGQACARSSDPLDLTLQLENLVVRILYRRLSGVPVRTPDVLATALADEVASALAPPQDA